MNQKRNRSVNWDDEEKQLFRTIMKEYSQVIEDKSLSTNTNKTKTKAWEEVHTKFNALNCKQRDLSQLKIQWKTMKMQARKTCYAFKKESLKTGGGAKPPSPDDSLIQIKDLLNPAELLRDENKYDSDGLMIDSQFLSPVMIKSPDEGNINTDTPQDTNIVEIEEVNVQIDGQESTSARNETIIMATPNINEGKGIRKRKLIANHGLKSTKDHNDYVTSITEHSKCLKESEHRRRMEMAEEEHHIRMAILKEKLKSAILEREISDLKKSREINL